MTKELYLRGKQREKERTWTDLLITTGQTPHHQFNLINRSGPCKEDLGRILKNLVVSLVSTELA